MGECGVGWTVGRWSKAGDGFMSEMDGGRGVNNIM